MEKSLAVSHGMYLTDRHIEDKCFIPASFFLWVSGKDCGGKKVDKGLLLIFSAILALATY